MNPTEKNAARLDQGEQVFFEDQLTLVKARTYDVIHKDLKALTLLPVSTEQDDAAEHIEYRSYDQVGMAKIVSDYANDFPRVDTLGTKKSVQVHSLGDSYGYSIQEIRRAARANFNLDARRAMAARRGIEEKQDHIAWFGDAKRMLSASLPLPRNLLTARKCRTRSSSRWLSTTSWHTLRMATTGTRPF